VIQHCVVNVAVGPGHVRGQQRLTESLRAWKYQGDFISWTDAYPPGSPTHQSAPYAFKFFALKEALRRGYDTVLWLDASFWAIDEPMKVFRVIDKRGYALWLSGWTTGEWTSDAALKMLRITREEAFKYPLVMGGAVGISKYHAGAMELLKRMLVYAADGATFPGAWDNKRKQVSTDSRVLGHRHDQPPLGVESKRLGLEPFRCPYLIAYWLSAHPEPDPRSVFICKGMD